MARLPKRRGIEKVGTYRYWQHFLALEADFAATARYVEFTEENFGAYSVEFAKLLLAVGSEIDVLCKVICEKLDSTAKRENIKHYRACFTKHTKIVDEDVLIRRYNLVFRPWSEWKSESCPSWWNSYNSVKHQRDLCFSEANFQNCANAISALFPLVIYCHTAENSPDKLEPYPILLGRDKEPGYRVIGAMYEIPPFS